MKPRQLEWAYSSRDLSAIFSMVVNHDILVERDSKGDWNNMRIFKYFCNEGVLKKPKMINYRLWWEIMTVLMIQYLADIYLFKVKYGNTRTMCENCSKLTIKTPSERHHTIDFTHWKFIIFVSGSYLLLLLTETFGLLKFSCRTQ